MNSEEMIFIASIAAQIGANIAMETTKKEKEKELQSRHDRRLRNTKLLLKNYRMLKEHIENSVFDLSPEETSENAIDILDMMWEKSNHDLQIKSIKRSVSRTAIIIKHIDTMLKIYEAYCAVSPYYEDKRRFKIIYMRYFDIEPMSIEDIADEECLAVRTVYKDINAATEKLSALIFGIDGIKK